MKLRLVALMVCGLLGVAGSAQAQESYKDRVAIPAPIPEGGAISVPTPMPIPEGFTYYLRADLGWGFAANRSFAEKGRVYGAEPSPFQTNTLFAFGDPQFLSTGTNGDDVFLGTIGFGAYFTPHLRGDLTLDFRGQQGFTSTSNYTYQSNTLETVTGKVTDTTRLNGVVGLANLYFDLLPRGGFTPYVGAGIGMVYNSAKRSYTDDMTADSGVPPPQTSSVTGSGSKNNVALAAALMAGASFTLKDGWMLDVSYRALYLGGLDVDATLNTTAPANGNSKATIGDTWEQQARIGLRLNIW
jgi:opacity protein-like surface antigen